VSVTTDSPAAPSRPPTGSKRVDAARLDELARRVTTAGAEREPIEVENPATGQLLGTVPRCNPEDVAVAVDRARAAQAGWRRTDWSQRRGILLRFHDLVLARQQELLDLIQLESGKARRHAFEEIIDVAVVARYYARTAERHLRTHRRRGALPLLTASWEHHHPVGVVGIITPWNYPLTLSISDAIPALAAGNAVVFKADSQTPFSALGALPLFEEAGLPRDVIQAVTGSGSELGPELIGRVDYVMFTGSTEVGRTVASQAAERLIPSSMELGGKNAMIVLEDVDLDRAVEGAERAMFSNAGQLCISIERLLVHESVADELVRRLVARIRGMRLGAGLNYDDDMGSLISRTQLETVEEHVGDAVEKGATVLAGGRARPDVGPYFYEPTLLADVSDDMTLFADETFGPVVSVSRFSSDEEAVAREPLRAQLQRLEPGRRPGPAARDPAAGGDGQRQRGLHRGLGLHRRADGRHEGLGAGAPPRRRGDPQVHRGPDGGCPEGPADRPVRTGAPAAVVAGDHRRPAAPAPAAWMR
jgi:succinate-semialdehyde dehydrogenase/glutarate-semialdehyde dehydrogenase